MDLDMVTRILQWTPLVLGSFLGLLIGKPDSYGLGKVVFLSFTVYVAHFLW